MKDELFTVIVADDEDELREAVCSLIPWESIGFKLVGSASNGLDALQLTEQIQPDLLLTDIHMPFISGTSLAKQVRELQPLIQVAFLSGYDDFKYAKLAIDYEVISYLLKPISTEELTKALQSIHEKMEARFRSFSVGTDTGSALQLFVSGLLLDSFGGPASEKTLDELAQLGLSISPSSQFLVLSTSIDSSGPAPMKSLHTVDNILKKRCSSCSIPSSGRILSLICSDNGFDALSAALAELQQAFRRLYGCSCTIGISRQFSSISDCHSACREAVEAQRSAGDTGIHRISDKEGVSLLCNKALHIIEQEYMDEAISLSSVSERLHVSPNYLSANMKKHAGDTFINLLIKKRMEAAHSLLSSGTLKIAEVARRCGYSDQHYFSFCFKKYYGVSPMKIRHGE